MSEPLALHRPGGVTEGPLDQGLFPDAQVQRFIAEAAVLRLLPVRQGRAGECFKQAAFSGGDVRFEILKTIDTSSPFIVPLASAPHTDPAGT